MNPMFPPSDDKLTPSNLPVYDATEIAKQKEEYVYSQLSDNRNEEPDYAGMILKQIDHDNVITEQEFEKYAILFSKELRAKLDDPDKAQTVDMDEIKKLSDEYYHRFNHYKPIYITDYKGNVINVLPAQYRRLDTIDHNTMNALMNKVRVATMYDDNNANSVANIESAHALGQIAKLMHQATNTNSVKQDQEQYNAFSNEFYIRKYAEMYNIDPATLKQMIADFYAGKSVVFPWQTKPDDAKNLKPVNDTTDDLPMDIFD